MLPLPGAWSSPLPSEACTGELTVALRGELAEAAARLSLSPCAAAGRHAAASSVDDDGCEAAARPLRSAAEGLRRLWWPVEALQLLQPRRSQPTSHAQYRTNALMHALLVPSRPDV